MRGAGRIAKFIFRVRVRKPAEADELADSLSPIQLQLGWPVSEQDAPQLALAEQVVELGGRHIDQEQDQYPELDRGKAMPGEDRDHVRQEAAHGVVIDEPEMHESLKQACDEDDGPVDECLEQDR